jgi:tight adherence protein C
MDVDAGDCEDQGLMNSYLPPLLAAALVGTAVLLAAYAFAEHRRLATMRRTLAVVLGGQDSTTITGERRTFASVSMMDSLVDSVGSRLVGRRARTRLRKHLAWAGRPTSESLTMIVGRKIIYLGVGLSLGLIAGVVFGGWAWALIPLAGFVGFYLPDVLVYNEAQHRTDEIRLLLPDALDLLNLCVESGLGLQAALARVAQSQMGAVAQEFGRVLQEMQLGVSRSAAFESMAQRTKQVDLQRFAAAMLQVDKLGIPVANVLREQAREMRATRHDRAREQAQKIPVKILAPLMLCFLPGLFIIILGPAAITAMSVLSGR